MNDATLRLLLGILAVICFWLGYNLMIEPLPRRRWVAICQWSFGCWEWP